jgi:molecular chaperone GrpE
MVDFKSTEKWDVSDKTESEEPVENDSTSQISDLTDTLKRLQAEFENYRKRVDNERCEDKKRASEQVLIELLTVVDNFELALKHAPTDDLMQLLESNGVKRIVCDQFNPYMHEALLAEKSDKPSNTILEVLQNGYSLHGKIIRTAKVKIAKEE